MCYDASVSCEEAGDGMDRNGTAVEAVALAARMILENGGETYRAEQTVERMAYGFGFRHVEVLAFPTGVTMTLLTEEGDSLTRIVRVNKRDINLARIDACNTISRSAASGRMTCEEALQALREADRKHVSKWWVQLAACALSSGFFAVMLSGGIPEFLIAVLCGLVTQLVLFALARQNVPGIISGMLCAICTAIIALAANRIQGDVQIEPVISGAIMPILPGLAMTNAIRDTITGDLISGGARSAEAILRALTLGAGIGIVISLVGGV